MAHKKHATSNTSQEQTRISAQPVVQLMMTLVGSPVVGVVIHSSTRPERAQQGAVRGQRKKARKREKQNYRTNLSRGQASTTTTTLYFHISLVACFRLNTSNYDETEDVDGSLGDGTSSCNKHVCFRFAKTSSSSCVVAQVLEAARKRRNW